MAAAATPAKLGGGAAAPVRAEVDVSFIVPVYNEEEGLPRLFAALHALARDLAPRTIEILLVDDGSRDGSWELIAAAAAADPTIAGVRLSRNFGQQMALACGYRLSRGRAMITLDADLQDPPEICAQLLREWEDGADIVYAVRRARPGETVAKRLTASTFYRLLEALGEGSGPRNCGDFRLMSRRAVDALNSLPERHRYIRGLVGWLGFRTATVHYDREPRVSGRTKYSLLKMLRLATDGIVSMSISPLSLAYIAATLAALPFLVYLAYNLVLWSFFGVAMVPGWPSLILAVTVFGSAVLVTLGLMGEYVGRIYEEVKRRPLYLVEERVGAAANAPDV